MSRDLQFRNQAGEAYEITTEMIDYPDEFKDVYKILTKGAKKHGLNSWLKGKSFNHNDNHASMFRHLSESQTGKIKDKETGEHPLLHLACRALMAYTLYKRGLT